jgi:hypothetical protein
MTNPSRSARRSVSVRTLCEIPPRALWRSWYRHSRSDSSTRTFRVHRPIIRRTSREAREYMPAWPSSAGSERLSSRAFIGISALRCGIRRHAHDPHLGRRGGPVGQAEHRLPAWRFEVVEQVDIRQVWSARLGRKASCPRMPVKARPALRRDWPVPIPPAYLRRSRQGFGGQNTDSPEGVRDNDGVPTTAGIVPIHVVASDTKASAGADESSKAVAS